MKVDLIAYTENAEEVCAIGAGTCTSERVPEGGAHTMRIGEEPKMVKALKHALESGHESVLEHASFTFAVSGVSRALTHQLVRHRVASYSQQSQRYVSMNDFLYVKPASIIENETELSAGMDSDGNDIPVDMCQIYDDLMNQIAYTYEILIRAGIPEEDARYILPNACCTNIVVTMNARELRHFFNLRCCERAQWEIRELADKMLALVKDVAPTIFYNAGPSCVQTGRCPEKKSCGRCKE